MVVYAINPTQPNHKHLIYMYKEDLVLIKLQWFICHKIKQNDLFKYGMLCLICYDLNILKMKIFLLDENNFCFFSKNFLYF